MKSPLHSINIGSIYFRDGQRAPLPKRMAQCTPDTRQALIKIAKDVEGKGGKLYLSDLFRSYDMQLQSHLEWKTGKKSAFSPPPGGSMHEAGRACDLDLDSLKIKLVDFWVIAKKHGMFPIIDKPKASTSEAWHFDCRGSHQIVYDYYRTGKGTNMKAYTAMAASGILAIGVRVDQFGKNQSAAALQAGLVRLGHEIGSIDGDVGMLTRKALEKAEIEWTTPDQTLSVVENQLKQTFPAEYDTSVFNEEIPG